MSLDLAGGEGEHAGANSRSCGEEGSDTLGRGRDDGIKVILVVILEVILVAFLEWSGWQEGSPVVDGAQLNGLFDLFLFLLLGGLFLGLFLVRRKQRGGLVQRCR